MPVSPKLKLIAVAIPAVMLGAFLLLRALGSVSPEDARRLVAEGALLVDVRSAGEYESGHIEGAVNFPLQTLSGRLEELGKRSTPLIVYCRSGTRSSLARSVLQKAGFTEVHDLGAMWRWPERSR